MNRASLILLVMLMSVNVWGAELTYTHAMTAKPDGGDNTLSGVTWTVDLTSNVGGMNTGNYAGVQIGTSSNTGSIKFTTKQAWGAQEGTYKGYTKVKYVYVWLNNGSGTIDATVKIGGVSASKSGTVSKNTSAGNDYKKASKLTFTPGTGGDNGVIEIVASTSSKAGYFCAIEVVCEKSAAPAAKIDVTLSRNGSTETISQQTSPYSLPAVADEDPACDGWEFKGWSSSSVASTTTAPTFVTQATASGTYYAVYGKTTEGGGGTEEFNFETIANAKGWENSKAYTPVTQGVITLNGNGGRNDAKYYTSDKTWRMYNGGTVEITSSAGGVSSVSSNPEKTFTISSGKATLSVSATTNFKSITVTYGSSTTTYTTSPDCGPATFTVNFAVNPAGYGSVSQASLANVESGTSISANGATLTVGSTSITATPATATAQYTYTFNNWTWSPTGSTITAATTATANFTRTENSYSVSYTDGGNVDYTSKPTSVKYSDATLTINATPKSGYSITGVSVTMGGSALTLDEDYTWEDGELVIMPTNFTGNIVITFTTELVQSCTNEITITKGTPSHGSFDLSQMGVVCIDDGNATVSVTNISPATHYHFKQITATNGSVDNTNKQVTNISANTTINVEFEEDLKYTITFVDAVHGTDCSAWNMNSYAGTQIVFNKITDKTAATPVGNCVADHYHFVGWVKEGTTPTKDPDNVIKAGTTSITITEEVTYKAVWAKEEL